MNKKISSTIAAVLALGLVSANVLGIAASASSIKVENAKFSLFDGKGVLVAAPQIPSDECVFTFSPNDVVGASLSINIAVPPNVTAETNNDMSFDSGDIVTFRLAYTPPSENPIIGLKNVATGALTTFTASNGTTNKALTVPARGTYRVYIRNVSADNRVTVTGNVNY